MIISDVRLKEDACFCTLSADCNGFRLFYRFPDELNVRLSADPFVAACLIPAMYLGTDIEIPDDVNVSPTLLENLSQLQVIFSMWEEQLGCKLSRVNIRGGRREPSRYASERNPVMSFFSGGVDGTYTFLEHEEEIDFLLFAKGIDMQLSNDELFALAFERNSAYLKKHGKRLLPCETNVRFLGHEYGLKWPVCFGGGLSSIALAIGAGRCLLASGVTYAATSQEGSNYITDRFWGNGVTQIIHDGANTSRSDKIKRLAEDSEALEILRVCWQDKGYNCGECEKCLRTMITLRLLGLSAPGFPEMDDKRVRTKLAKLKIYGVQNFGFVEESLALAKTVDDRVVFHALRRQRRDYLLRRHLRGLLSAFR